MLLFKSHAVEDVNPNVLVMRIQPDEGVSLTFEVKPPGHDMIIKPLSLDFNYEEAFGNSPPEAYETLLEDCIEGDSTLFTRHDWVELAWSLVDPIIQVWNLSRPRNFPNYEAGSWGPKKPTISWLARAGAGAGRRGKKKFELTTKVTKGSDIIGSWLRALRITIVQNLRGPRKYSGREFLPPSRKGAKVMGKGQKLL